MSRLGMHVAFVVCTLQETLQKLLWDYQRAVLPTVCDVNRGSSSVTIFVLLVFQLVFRI